jgi:nucleoside 2-deoxyribosyltransferase
MSTVNSTCALCRGPAGFEPPTGDRRTVTCQRCGTYSIDGTAEALLSAGPRLNVGAVSGWVRRHDTMRLLPNISGDDVAKMRALTKPPFQERVEQYLLAFANRISKLDQTASPVQRDLVAISYSDDPAELLIIIRHLEEQGLLIDPTPGVASNQRRLTPKGFMMAEDLRRKRAAHTQAFVAMQFSEEMRRIYDQGFDVGIRRAGFQPMLISNKEHANKIDDEIIAEIRRSAFLVADFTGHRQNVYFETGFAIGLGLQVVWTCKKNEIAALHFDIRQYNCIAWEDGADLAQKLQHRIEAMFGQGPLGIASPQVSK